ncbi:hypothetical protein ACHAWF_001749 [Thalassiosira exigua]
MMDEQPSDGLIQPLEQPSDGRPRQRPRKRGGRALLFSALLVCLAFLSFSADQRLVGKEFQQRLAEHFDDGPPPAAAGRPSSAPAPRPEDCTAEQLGVVRWQLPPDDCVRYQRQPWTQRCSHSYATRCPDAVWLGDFYARRHAAAAENPAKSSPEAPFVGIFVGCNKGMDAVDALRMGSGDPRFDKGEWVEAMTRGGKVELRHGVCDQISNPQFALPPQRNDTDDGEPRRGLSPQLHCVEPVPATYAALARAAYETGYDKRGLVVKQAAVSGEDGVAPFRRRSGAGQENTAITPGCPPSECVEVPLYRLDTYVERFVPPGSMIDYLSVDAEGHDYEVILGGEEAMANRTAAGAALGRVRYLEFEYNWSGPWGTRSLREAIDRLDRRHGFTCYWAGFNGTLRRITGCWLEHYDIKFWSNVACVNRDGGEEAREIGEDMERRFIETLGRNDVIRDYEHRYRRPDEVDKK